MTSYRVQVTNTRFGTISAWVYEFDHGFKAVVDATEYPGLPTHQSSDATLADSVEAAVNQLRRALNGT